MNNAAVILFTRVPSPGTSKTRLIPLLGKEGACELQEALLKDLSQTLSTSQKKLSFDLIVFETPFPHPNPLVQLFPTCTGFFPQSGADLGERMNQAIQQVLNSGYTSVLLIGSDIPEIDESCLRQAFDLLREKDVVLGPTKDGGYYLVGMKQKHPFLFQNQTYGHHTVLESALESLKAHSTSCGLVKALSDIDTAEDLVALWQRYQSVENQTASFLRRLPHLPSKCPKEKA